MSVVGFDDIPLVDMVSPPLTTVHVRLYDTGAEAARLMLELLRDSSLPPKSVLLPVSLVVRGSTATPPVGWAPGLATPSDLRIELSGVSMSAGLSSWVALSIGRAATKSVDTSSSRRASIDEHSIRLAGIATSALSAVSRSP